TIRPLAEIPERSVEAHDMKIGVELYHITMGATGGLAPLVQGLLDSTLSGWPEHDVVIFHKDDVDPAFALGEPQAHNVRLPKRLYFPWLDLYAAQLGIDVLLRTYPHDAELAFPMERQVVLIPDIQHEFYPEFFTPEVLEGRRAGFAQALSRAGAVLTLS